MFGFCGNCRGYHEAERTRAVSRVPDRLGLAQQALAVDRMIGAGGESLPEDVPSDPALAGVLACLQALEYDPGVVKKLSFTFGVEAHVGY